MELFLLNDDAEVKASAKIAPHASRQVAIHDVEPQRWTIRWPSIRGPLCKAVWA